jgi:RluA family pseudouridine synthase
MKWVVPAREKLVAFLQGQLGDYSGKQIRRLLEANLCRINGQIERFGSRFVQSGDAVCLAPQWKSLFASRSTPFHLVYENEEMKIVDKPAGWVCSEEDARRTFGPGHFLVHRLDKETTGLLILAKNNQAKAELTALFAKREIEKSYLALVDGIPSEKEGIRRSFLCKKGAFQGQTIWGSGARGLTAVTRWQKWAEGDRAALVLCEPETGRTHQIRVHMAEMGHPILVDRQYARSFQCPFFFQRPLLHAYRLRFDLGGEKIEVMAPLPLDMREALRGVGIEMRHLRQFFGEEEQDERRDERHGHEQAEKVEEPSHFIHQTR